MKTKYQILVVMCAVLFLVGGGLVLSLTQFNAPVAEASNALQAQEVPGRAITVVGEGKVSAAPDIAVAAWRSTPRKATAITGLASPVHGIGQIASSSTQRGLLNPVSPSPGL